MSNPIDWNLLKLCDCDGFWHTASNGPHRPSVYLDDLVEERVRQARIEELESLEHEPQMHGDWQQALADRLDTLRSNNGS